MLHCIGKLRACTLLCLFGRLALLGAARDDGYVASKTCFACHESIYRSFGETSMGRSLRPANELTAGTIPATARVGIPSTTRSIEVAHNETGWRQSETEPGVFVDEHKLDYVIGSGVNGFSFIVRKDGYLFQAPLSFYSKAGGWGLSPGYESADFGFSRPIAQECIVCHSGRAQPIGDTTGHYAEPPFRELAIGCENCHGPGKRHVEQPKQRGLIVNPAKLEARLAEEICLNCHQGGDARILQPGKNNEDFRPGEWLVNTAAIFKLPPKVSRLPDADLLEHNSAMKASRCFRGSQGKLSCLTCHDPHVKPSPSNVATYYREKCLTCHTDRSCPVPVATRIGQAGSDNCVACHMPKRAVAVISHSALTNHRIPARPDETFPPAVSNSGTDLMLVDEAAGRRSPMPDLTLLRAYGELVGRDPSYPQRYFDLLQKVSAAQPKEPYVQAALGHKALVEGKNEEALEHLKLGMALGSSTVVLDLAQALANLGRAAEGIPYLETGLERDPYNGVLRKTLTLQYINLKRYAEARSQMQKYVELFPQDNLMRNLLARVGR